jgi:hypothetical protein
MSAAAAMRLTQLHGEPKSTLAGPAHARDGTEMDRQERHSPSGSARRGSRHYPAPSQRVTVIAATGQSLTRPRTLR